MKTALTIFTVVVLSILAGCDGAAEQKQLLSREKELLKEGKELLTVDFQEGQSLRYRFVSSRDIALDWDPTKSRAKPGQSSIDKSSESLEIVVSYTPIEVDPYNYQGNLRISKSHSKQRPKRTSCKKGRGGKPPRQNFHANSECYGKNKRLFTIR